MKRTQKFSEEIKSSSSLKRSLRGLLTVALAAAMVLCSGLPLTGASCAADSGTGSVVVGDAENRVQNQTVHYAYIAGYPDGEVKPLERITREEAAAIFSRLMTEESRNTFEKAVYDADTSPFNDVDPARWSCRDIAALYNAKIIQGYEDGSFHPAKPITRAEFAAMAARFDSLDDTPGNRFPDIDNHWAVTDINAAAEKGWVRAYGDLTFRPENTILRCEAMMWINDAQDRTVNAAGLHIHSKHWPDNTEDKWYYEIVMEAGNTHNYERIAGRKKSTEKWTSIVE